MKAAGLGPGALVSWPGHRHSDGTETSFLAMVERINLGRVHGDHAVDDSRYTYYSPEVILARYITEVTRWGDRIEHATVRVPSDMMNPDGYDMSERNLADNNIEIVSPVEHVSVDDEAFDRDVVLKAIYASIDN